MTRDEYRALIAEAGLSQRQAAKAIGVNERTSRRYAIKGVPDVSDEMVHAGLKTWASTFKQMARREEDDAS